MRGDSDWRDAIIDEVMKGGLFKTVESYPSNKECRKELDKVTTRASSRGFKIRTKIGDDDGVYYGYLWRDKE